jgi:uncharacterized membrane protein YtjA (UPF0391 family)
MLRLALLFMLIALLAGYLGIAPGVVFSFEAARILFFVFLVLAVLFFLGNFVRRAPRDLL